MEREYITVQKDHEEGRFGDAWVCLCGNTSTSQGFYPCDDHGKQISPDVDGPWINLYVCDRCGRIINQDTLEVVGRASNEARVRE